MLKWKKKRCPSIVAFVLVCDNVLNRDNLRDEVYQAYSLGWVSAPYSGGRMVCWRCSVHNRISIRNLILCQERQSKWELEPGIAFKCMCAITLHSLCIWITLYCAYEHVFLAYPSIVFIYDIIPFIITDTNGLMESVLTLFIAENFA